MDSFNEQLLAAMEFSGVIPNSTDQQRRLDDLVAEGWCSCELRSMSSAGFAAATNIYHLTPAGYSRDGRAAKIERQA